jgi:hypothetical protein
MDVAVGDGTLVAFLALASTDKDKKLQTPSKASGGDARCMSPQPRATACHKETLSLFRVFQSYWT